MHSDVGRPERIEDDDSTDTGWIHVVRAGSHVWEGNLPPEDLVVHQKHIKPWLAALLQAERVSLLIGSGLTTAIATLTDIEAVDMSLRNFESAFAEEVNCAAAKAAARSSRGNANFEDQIRAANELIAGVRILANSNSRAAELLASWEEELNIHLRGFVEGILESEQGIDETLRTCSGKAERIRRLLSGFLLAFASRPSTRERLHIFTTNYDRVIEYGCDLLGLRIIDRFVGQVKSTFQNSQLGIDFHYNPPGIRGEPRYLDGVVRFTKLHGSVDWREEYSISRRSRIVRSALPFGASPDHPDLPQYPRDDLIIYPNPAKDIETVEYPYSELFRDFAATACQPDCVVVTYGYSFGDDHINRVLRDMLKIPSAHLVIISYDDRDGRISRFYHEVARDDQITVLVGNHFGGFATLVEHYLPKPTVDQTTWRMVDLIERSTLSESREERDPVNEQGGTAE